MLWECSEAGGGEEWREEAGRDGPSQEAQEALCQDHSPQQDEEAGGLSFNLASTFIFLEMQL